MVDLAETCGRVATALITADLIRIARDLKFPEFSNDGQYLVLHTLQQMKDHLGSPHDDAQNLFTARMLLLLESCPLAHETTYERVLAAIIESYYRDYHDHTDNFKPVFLCNDVIRFWKTMCLNYEHKRHRVDKSQESKNKSHLDNLKLKFSRMTTCYSMVLLLAKNHETLTPDRLLALARMTPRQRLMEVAAGIQSGDRILAEMLDLYSWFLETTGRPKSNALGWIQDRSNRDQAFGKARRYGALMWEMLLQVTTKGGDLRYVVI